MSWPPSVGGHVRRQELRGLELLGHREGLGLRTAAGLVEAGERQEDDEAEQHREAGGQHAEHAGRPVAVVEEAAVGGPTPHDEQQRDDRAGGNQRDHDTQDQVDLATVLAAVGAGIPLCG